MPKILIVCEGNVCRSPYFERVLRARLDHLDLESVRVDSAGTHATPGVAMLERSARAVTAQGGVADDFTATRLGHAELDGVDLVLTMERRQRSEVLDIVPAVLRRTFAVREFARLATRFLADAERRAPDEPADLWRTAPEVLAAYRDLSTSTEDDDVADPVLGDDTAFAVFQERVAHALDATVRFAERATSSAAIGVR